MTFLNPGILWFALAAAIPIIVHLFNLRRPKRLLFSNVSFLKEVDQAVRRRLRLRQLLVLAARVLAILLLVLAFANPVLTGDNTNQVARNHSVVLVLDDSRSMSVAGDKGVLLQHARYLAREIVQAYGPADEFLITSASRLKLGGSFTGRADALNRLEQLDYSNRTPSLGSLAETLPLLFQMAGNSARTVYLLSDLQRSVWLADTLKSLENVPKDISLKLVPLATAAPGNLFVADVKLKDPVLEPGKPALIEAEIENDGAADMNQANVKLVLGAKTEAMATVQAAAGRQQQAQFAFTPREPGWKCGSLQLDDMPADFDNRHYIALNIPAPGKLLVIKGAGEDSKYLEAFFGKLIQNYSYKAEIADERNAAQLNLAGSQAVVLAGISQLSSGFAERLARYVQEGGGLLVFPSSTDFTGLNSLLAALQAGSYSAPKTAADGQLWQLAEPDLQHPIFRGVFLPGSRSQQFDGPAIKKLAGYTPGPAAVQQTILGTKDGMPALQEVRSGSGRLLIWSFYPSLPWSDFPVKPAFAPILYRSLLLLGQTAEPVLARSLGSLQPMQVRQPRSGTYRLVAEDGQELIPEQYTRPGYTQLLLDKAALNCGCYALRDGDSTVMQLAFNYPAAESRLTPADANEVKKRLTDAGLSNVAVLDAAPAVLAASVQQAALGQALWPWLLAAALLMLLAEMLLLKLWK